MSMQSTSFGLTDGGLILRRSDRMKAADHAINQHDALTQINKELVAALNELLNGYSGCRSDIGIVQRRKAAQAALAKAKELAE